MSFDLLVNLRALAEEPYRQFTQTLIPDGKPLIGVRMGKLRTIAKELAKSNWDPFDAIAGDTFHEQTIIRALVIAYQPIPEQQRIKNLENFLPYIDNWAICDSLCTTFTHVHACEHLYMRLIQDHLQDHHPYAVRFSVVMLLNHFIDERYLDQVFDALTAADREHYYISMAVAWAAATAFTRIPKRVKPWLSTHPLTEQTMRMTARKISDSRQIPKDEKAWIARVVKASHQ